MDLYPIIRNLQSQFPGLLNLKVEAQRNWRRMRRKPFEPEFEILKYLDLPNGDVCLDIGANRGQSIDAIRLYKRNTKIIAFEPNEALATALASRFSEDSALDVRNYGLSDAANEQPLYMPVYRKFMYDGLSSFDRDEAEGWLSEETVAGFDRSKLEIREMICRTERLDDLNLAPGFVKIDVQGFEPHVLAGGKTALEDHAPLILLETNPEADSVLTGWGWERFSWQSGKLVAGTRGHNNTLYLKEAGKRRLPAEIFS